MDEKGELLVLNGKITEIVSFGAMVKLEDGTRGLIHISEVSDDYVYNVEDYLTVGMDVTVAVISDRDANKKRLSVRQAGIALPKLPRIEANKKPKISSSEKKARKKAEAEKRRYEQEIRLLMGPPDEVSAEGRGDVSFEDRLKKYMKDSEARLVDVKHQTEGKRGGSNQKKG